MKPVTRKTSVIIMFCLVACSVAAVILAAGLFRTPRAAGGLPFALAAAIGLTAYFAYRAFGLRAMIPIVGILGVTYALAMPYFSPIDEGNHFAYVHFIATKHALPLVDDYTPMDVLAMADHVYPGPHNKEAWQCGLEGRMYEAQHPPLYYLLAAIVSALIPAGLIAKLYWLRVIGALCFAVTAALLIKTYRFAVKRELIHRSDGVFYTVLALFMLSPGPMLRMATVSNINLSMPLSAMMLFLLVRSIFDDDRAYIRRSVQLGTLAGGMTVCQILSGVFAPVAAAIVLLRTRSIKRLARFAVPFGLVFGLWIAYNFYAYGEPTAFSKVRMLIEPVTNPLGQTLGLGYIKQGLPRFLETLWAPEDAGDIHRWGWILALGLSGAGFAAVCIAGLRSLIDRRAETAGRRQFTLICIGALALNAIVILYESGWTWQGALLGRYMYVTLPCAVFTFYLAAGKSRAAWLLLIPAAAAALALYATVLANMIGFGGMYPL